MHTPFFGEFMGTLVLVMLGNGVVANVVLKKTLGENSGWIVICTGYGLGVMAGVFTAIACGSPGAHINPALTLDQGSKLACFSTGPAVKSTGWNIFSETLGTFLLVAIIGSIFSKSVG